MDIEIDLTSIWDAITFPFARSSRKWSRLMRRVKRKKGRSRFSRLSPSQQRLRKIKLMRKVALLALAGAVAGMLGFFLLFAWYSRDLPKPGQVVRREGFSTRIFSRDEEFLYDLYDSQRRDPVSFADIPEVMRNATIAIEDKDFYTHGGFDFMTILRIPYNVLFRQRVVGGSTLTQQLVKNVLLTNERTISRKFKEFVLATQIERTFTKDQIIEMYLNEAPYGGTAWGVGTASQVYFSKPVNELSVLEAAVLAGLPQRPSVYSPLTGKADKNGEPYWKMRTQGVLRRMKEDGYISNIEYDEALSGIDDLTFEQLDTEIQAPHFVFYVKDKLVEMFGEDLMQQGGLKVTTTLDLELHNEAQKIVAEEIEDVEDFGISNGSVMVMDPKTGEILSMVGSRDYFNDEIGGQYNVAADGLRQPGSSIKPVTYLALLQLGYTPSSQLIDVETTFTPHDNAENPYTPQNYDGQFRGPVSVRNSLGSSLNVPAVKSIAKVGVENFLNLAYSMGFETLEPSQENLKRFGLALTLGGGEVHLIDTVTAYSAFANGGIRVEPISILKVEDKNGKVLFEQKPVEGRRIFSEGEAFLINNILSDNNARLLAFGVNSLLNTGRPIAVKTGTTNDQRDNWTIGWSQNIMVGVWVGNNDNTPMKKVASGITGASPIWRRVILEALKQGYTAPEWVMPDSVEQVEVDSISGYSKHDDFPTRTDYAIKGTVLGYPDPIHLKAKICRGENKLATQARISAGDYDEKEFIVLKEDDVISQDGRNRWQEAIDGWVNGQEDTRYKYPSEYCGESGDVSVKLSKPENEKKYDGEEIEVNISAGSDDGIEKIELYVNGQLKETINNHDYSGKIKLSAGRYELYAKAKSRSGKESKSNTVKIGTGGQDWKEAEPTPTPSPVPTVAPSPTATPSATPAP